MPEVPIPQPWQVHTGTALAWLADLPDSLANAFIFDPPYCSGGRSATARKRSPSSKYLRPSARNYPEFEGDQRDQRGWLQWMTLIIAQAHRVARTGAPIVIFCDWRQQPTAADALQAGGFVWRGTLAWDKTGAARPMLGRFTQQAEFIVWGSKGAMDTQRRVLSYSNVLPGVFRHRVDPNDKHHTTGKPTPLMHEIVRISEPGGLIIDPFAGRGTTGVAALQLGYRFLGCELSPEYAAIAHRRLADAVAVSSGRSDDNQPQLSLGARS